MKVAFTSSDGRSIDVPFDATPHFYVWEVERDAAHFLVRTTALLRSADADERAAVRANAVASCTLVCALEVDDLDTAKLVRRNVLPLSTRKAQSIREMVTQLQGVLRNPTTPWLRRAARRSEEAQSTGADAPAADC